MIFMCVVWDFVVKELVFVMSVVFCVIWYLIVGWGYDVGLYDIDEVIEYLIVVS